MCYTEVCTATFSYDCNALLTDVICMETGLEVMEGCVKRCVAHTYTYIHIPCFFYISYILPMSLDVGWLNCLTMHWCTLLTHSYGKYILPPLCLHASRYVCTIHTYIYTSTLWWYIKVQKKNSWFDVTLRRSMTASFISFYLDLRYHPLNMRSSNHPAPLLTKIQYQCPTPPYQPYFLRFICKIQWGLCWWTFRCNICLITQKVGFVRLGLVENIWPLVAISIVVRRKRGGRGRLPLLDRRQQQNLFHWQNYSHR